MPGIIAEDTSRDSMTAEPSPRRAARPVATTGRWLACAIVFLALSACQSLLPSARQTTYGPWNKYDEAVAAIEALVPYRTTTADLLAAGIDPETTPSITNLTYSDLLARFSPGAAVTPEKLDRGLRDCFMAGKDCRGMLVVASHIRQRRVGNFWSDALNFRRQTDITGWRFNAIIVVVDDFVVFAVHGGQPTVQDRQVTRNPLGPLQSFGDVVGSQISK